MSENLLIIYAMIISPETKEILLEDCIKNVDGINEEKKKNSQKNN